MSTSWNSTSPWTPHASIFALTLSLASLPLSAGAEAVPSTNPVPSTTASASSDPCLQLSNLVSRPSSSTAACVVKPNALLVQTGYANLSSGGKGGSRSVTYPQEALSTGIVRNVELDLTPASIARQSGAGGTYSGATDGSIGVKVQLGQTSRFTYGFNAAYTLQSGTAPFTGSGDGILANLNGSYQLSPAIGLFASTGYDEQSAGTPEFPASYHDIQPSLGASVALPQGLAFYAEGFGQSATGPGTDGTFGFDTGFQKDIGSRLQLDAEIFEYPGAHAGLHEHAVGFGAAYLFGP